MPFNLPGTLVAFHILVNPRVILPSIAVADIRQLDFAALKRAGYRGAVLDKDNCLTIPHDDRLVPELQEAWKDCQRVFGPQNILIVSNSAGTHLDTSGLQAESVSHHLGSHVLFHRSFKPSYSCASAIRKYFGSLECPIETRELVVVGDRVFTDVVLARRLGGREGWVGRIGEFFGVRWTSDPKLDLDEKTQDSTSRVAEKLTEGPLAVWTTGVWQREGMAMRWAESQVVKGAERWIKGTKEEREAMEARFVKVTESSLVGADVTEGTGYGDGWSGTAKAVGVMGLGALGWVGSRVVRGLRNRLKRT
ncbi:uncharacterized protein STEHIDRAFT_125618 [Stereum hirsutum FP-91666 SS1]|uniref:uncharacterized protein n=1 Tax=Stereum hirsutum (strain FP-91666) TaxID=721885 RepID=UPI0004449E73|nr:uncharacterized protein STEHIDRAFT_125618 [Stereum hirsutum FP-91666 SS1]EIM80562.1 hypothetical protein STEHIDRAFT_125618 [Stereum hirsutum FP-91666 SS1]